MVLTANYNRNATTNVDTARYEYNWLGLIEASVNDFNNKTGRLKDEKVSMTSKMVQNTKVHNKIYRKKGENPILLIPGSKS